MWCCHIPFEEKFDDPSGPVLKVPLTKKSKYDCVISSCFPMSQALGRSDSDVFYGWRLLFAVPLLFSLVQLALLPWSPRSPRFLLIKRKNEAAAKRGGCGQGHVILTLWSRDSHVI